MTIQIALESPEGIVVTGKSKFEPNQFLRVGAVITDWWVPKWLSDGGLVISILPSRGEFDAMTVVTGTGANGYGYGDFILPAVPSYATIQISWDVWNDLKTKETLNYPITIGSPTKPPEPPKPPDGTPDYGVYIALGVGAVLLYTLATRNRPKKAGQHVLTADNPRGGRWRR